CSENLVYQTANNYHQFGVTSNPHTRHSGQRRILISGDVKFIRALLAREHGLYLDEIQHRLSERRGV
ncbi:hypothetical protein FA95DRAFT_1472254, partial [Auriscalpium vulgare]